MKIDLYVAIGHTPSIETTKTKEFPNNLDHSYTVSPINIHSVV